MSGAAGDKAKSLNIAFEKGSLALHDGDTRSVRGATQVPMPSLNPSLPPIMS